MALTPRLIVRLPAPAFRSEGSIGVNINARWLDPVRFVATTGSLGALVNGASYAGLTLATGDTFLYQPTSGGISTPGITSGIYVVGAGAPTRRVDADTGAELLNAAVFISSGTPGAGQSWINVNSSVPVVGTDNIIFRQISTTSDVFTFDTRTAATGAMIANSRQMVQTYAYATAGDGGGALYKRVGGAPSHAGKFQSADGAWWEINESELTPEMFGAAGVDDTNAFADLFACCSAQGRAARLTGRTYVVSTLTPPAGITINTDGAQTVIQQKAGTGATVTIWNIANSDITIGSHKLKGNISSDTGEQKHAVFIRGAADIGRIRLGMIVGENIRGDVLYIGGLATAAVSEVMVDGVHAINTLRNVVTISGGRGVDIGSITGDRCGLYMFDCEPNSNSQEVDQIWVGHIHGHSVGLVGLSSYASLGHDVVIDSLDLDPGYTADSNPAYGFRATTVINGLWLRNARTVRIGHFKARNISRQPIFAVTNAGERMLQLLKIGEVDFANCGSGEATYNTMIQAAGVQKLQIEGGLVVLPAATKTLVLGSGASGLAQTRADIRVRTNGTLANAVVGGRMDVTIHSGVGLNALPSVRLASSANVTISSGLANGSTVDGVVVATNDRVLLYGQTAPTENGIYLVPASGAASRVSDADIGAELFGSYVDVTAGTQAGKRFNNTNATLPVVGTDAITFALLANYDAYTLIACANVKLQGSIVLGRLALNSTNLTLENLVATCATFLWSGGDKHVAINATLNADTYALGTTARDYTIPLRASVISVWPDATGKLRIKNTVPTTDLDGTVVGTQT